MSPTEKRPFRLVTESARERETLLYAADLIKDAKVNNGGLPRPASELRSSHDAVLTALAQLGALRTATARSLISVFDESYQYIVAESTPSMPLGPDLRHDEHGEELWLCGTAIPRNHGVCDYTVCGQDPDRHTDSGCDLAELPLTKVDDLGATSTFSTKPYCLPGNPAKFYAAVPIRTRRGINIGVYCVIHSEPVPEWGICDTKVMRELSDIIMGHLEAKRQWSFHRRSERMNRGFGSFLENCSTLSGWRSGPFPSAYQNRPELEGSLNTHQQAAQVHNLNAMLPTSDMSRMEDGQRSFQSFYSTNPTRSTAVGEKFTKEVTSKPALETSTATSQDSKSPNDKPVNHIFARAANIVRESIEVEGCLFVDPSCITFGSFSQESEVNEPYLSSSPSSGSEKKGATSGEEFSTSCKVLGFSTSDQHSVNGDSDMPFRGIVAQKFVMTLLRRYPNGHIFNFDSKGDLQSSDSSDNSVPCGPDDTLPPHRSQVPKAEKLQATRMKPWAREHEGSSLHQIFPGARSVGFMPIWDPKKERWHAVEFAYTRLPSRCFSKEGELSFMRVFGMLTMETVLRHETLQADKAKSDALSCISHELRSPLHGVLLGVELLNDTNLSVFQGNVSHTIETCCRTLVDTVDHLLDYSKINNFDSTTKQRPVAHRNRGLRHGTSTQIDAGLMTLVSSVNLNSLAEDVVESVFSGFYFQYLSVKQVSQGSSRKFNDAAANSKTDGMRAIEDLGPDSLRSEEYKANLGDVSIFFMVDPNYCWTFYTEGGAIRRIIMNLFGNAMKYTSKGVIKVSLTQRLPKAESVKRLSQVIITVTDTGAGISQDYLDNHLFRPFSQENSLSPGTGLGLSIVKRIVSHLRGRISVSSKLGVGTTISVTLPLRLGHIKPGKLKAPSVLSLEHKNNLDELRGLRVCLLGFKTATDVTVDLDGHTLNGMSVLRSICTEWLNLEVVHESSMADIRPDLVILSENALPGWEGKKVLLEAPAIVVCPNSLVAYQRSTGRSACGQQAGLLEFISQPIGPQKLGKILNLVFRRWRDSQDLSSDGSPSDEVSSLTTNTSTPDNEPCPKTRMRVGLSQSDKPGEKSLNSLAMLDPPAKLRFLTPVSRLRPDLLRTTSSTLVQYLLVDDNSINLNILSVYMGKLKRKFRTATNGQEAVDAYKMAPAHCNCIFMDISMPVMDGLKATRAIRSFERENKLKPATVIALTGLASYESQQEAFTSGVDLFLTKPVKLKELTSILKSRGMLSAET